MNNTTALLIVGIVGAFCILCDLIIHIFLMPRYKKKIISNPINYKKSLLQIRLMLFVEWMILIGILSYTVFGMMGIDRLRLLQLDTNQQPFIIFSGTILISLVIFTLLPLLLAHFFKKDLQTVLDEDSRAENEEEIIDERTPEKEIDFNVGIEEELEEEETEIPSKLMVDEEIEDAEEITVPFDAPEQETVNETATLEELLGDDDLIKEVSEEVLIPSLLDIFTSNKEEEKVVEKSTRKSIKPIYEHVINKDSEKSLKSLLRKETPKEIPVTEIETKEVKSSGNSLLSVFEHINTEVKEEEEPKENNLLSVFSNQEKPKTEEKIEPKIESKLSEKIEEKIPKSPLDKLLFTQNTKTLDPKMIQAVQEQAKKNDLKNDLKRAMAKK